MKLEKEKIFKTLNPNKVWIPVLLGVSIVAFLFYQDDSVTVENLSLIFEAEIIPVALAFWFYLPEMSVMYIGFV